MIRIELFRIADTFGVTTNIPHSAEADGPEGRWWMFSLSGDRSATGAAPDYRLIVLPAAMGILDGPAIEDVLLLRDELADMSWGIERSVLGPSGTLLDRALAWRAQVPSAAPPATNTSPRYRLGSAVPDYWIPFLPVGVTDTHLQLRRGIPPTSSSEPLGRVLGVPGLTMFLDERPREGVHLERRFRYTRGPDGSTFLWIGRRRSTGRGGAEWTAIRLLGVLNWVLASFAQCVLPYRRAPSAFIRERHHHAVPLLRSPVMIGRAN